MVYNYILYNKTYNLIFEFEYQNVIYIVKEERTSDNLYLFQIFLWMLSNVLNHSLFSIFIPIRKVLLLDLSCSYFNDTISWDCFFSYIFLLFPLFFFFFPPFTEAYFLIYPEFFYLFWSRYSWYYLLEEGDGYFSLNAYF